MVIQLFLLVVHIVVNALELVYYIGIVFAAAEFRFVAGIKYLRHIEPVEPYLVGIYLLVPEVARTRAGLSFYLFVKQVCRLFILFLARFAVQIEEYTPLVYVVEIVCIEFESAYAAVLENIVIDEFVDKIDIFFISGLAIYGIQRRHHATVDIIPAGRLAVPYVLYVPNRRVGSRVLDKTVDIPVDYRIIHNTPLTLLQVLRSSSL